jgi:hypothetical protein
MCNFIKKSEQFQINNLIIYLKVLEKQQQTKPKISRWEEIKIRAEYNEMETKEQYKGSIKQRDGSLKR